MSLNDDDMEGCTCIYHKALHTINIDSKMLFTYVMTTTPLVLVSLSFLRHVAKCVQAFAVSTIFYSTVSNEMFFLIQKKPNILICFLDELSLPDQLV